MKAILFDYADGKILLLPIPQDEENDADAYVRSHPCYDDKCMFYMMGDGNTFSVYDVIQLGEDIDGYPDYTLNLKTTI